MRNSDLTNVIADLPSLGIVRSSDLIPATNKAAKWFLRHGIIMQSRSLKVSFLWYIILRLYKQFLPELVDAGDLLRLDGPGLLVVLLRGVEAIFV